MNKYLTSIVGLALLVPQAHAKPNYGSLVVTEIISVYDGDTFRANVAAIGVDGTLHPILGQNIGIRVRGIDTPEIRGKCDSEKALALKAKNYTKMFLNRADVIELRNVQRGKYFRIVADVYDTDMNLSDGLLRANLGYIYHGKTKKTWCKNEK